MSLFTKTIVVRGGMSHADADALVKVFKDFAVAVKERIEPLEKEIEELRNEVITLKREQRMSVAQKLRARGY